MIPVWMPFILTLVVVAVLMIHARVGRNWRRSAVWIASLLPLAAVYLVLTIGIISDDDLPVRALIGRWGVVCLIAVQLSMAISDIVRWRWKPKH